MINTELPTDNTPDIQVTVVKAAKDQRCAQKHESEKRDRTAVLLLQDVPLCAACAGELAGELTLIATNGAVQIHALGIREFDSLIANDDDGI